MDLGLYNKAVQARGSHGTLIDNWVEERALAEHTGQTRYGDQSKYNWQDCLLTEYRINYHSNNCNGDPNNRSIQSLHYQPYGPKNFSERTFFMKSYSEPKTGKARLGNTHEPVIFGTSGSTGVKDRDRFKTSYQSSFLNARDMANPDPSEQDKWKAGYDAPGTYARSRSAFHPSLTMGKKSSTGLLPPVIAAAQAYTKPHGSNPSSRVQSRNAQFVKTGTSLMDTYRRGNNTPNSASSNPKPRLGAPSGFDSTSMRPALNAKPQVYNIPTYPW